MLFSGWDSSNVRNAALASAYRPSAFRAHATRKWALDHNGASSTAMAASPRDASGLDSFRCAADRLPYRTCSGAMGTFTVPLRSMARVYARTALSNSPARNAVLPSSLAFSTAEFRELMSSSHFCLDATKSSRKSKYVSGVIGVSAGNAGVGAGLANGKSTSSGMPNKVAN